VVLGWIYAVNVSSCPRALGSRAMRRAIVFALVEMLGAAQALVPAKANEYRLSAGDALELVAVGVPDLRQRSVIGPDGLVFFPLLGPLRVAGSTLQEVRAKVQSSMPDKVYRRRSADGRDDPVVLAPDEINVTIAEYRPVYLNGDVSKPGEQPYRPGMTVHQAIAVAGGYEIMRFRMSNPFLDAIDFRHELTSLELDYARQTAYVQRLLAESEGKLEVGKAQAEAEAPIVASIQTAEAEQFRLRHVDSEKEQSYLQDAIESVADRVGKLSDQQGKERDGTSTELAELGHLKELMEKGLVPSARIADARRMALLSATSLLQTGAMLGQAIRERQDLERRLQQLPDQRRMDLVRELESAQIDVAKLESRTRAVQQKLAYAGILRSQLVEGGSNPKLTIFRDGNGHREQIEAQEYTQLQPGDLIEVAIWIEDVRGAAHISTGRH
jgi:polysaccharide biosynthesis/export protein